ncbi:MAG: hypothetical protein F4Y24_17385 [Gemmatimonadetes bacterium]|nr:hypothetical protein [Gemmatimonadota bacterium]MYG20959.1 hypothetical protein [Gemmatimonadota bacterium]MYJ37599.1 hypothetical protein [Gemmatimonadota bacterium]
MRKQFVPVLSILAALSCSPVAPDEPEPALPTYGTVTVKLVVPLPVDLRAQYFDSALIMLQSREQEEQSIGTIVASRYPVTDTVVVVDRLPFGTYRIAFEQPRVDGWGDSEWVCKSCLWSPSKVGFGDWFTIGPYIPEREIEHIANYDAAVSGAGYLSGCYYDSGNHCHRDKWTFATGPVALDRTFSDGETHVILVDRRFFRPDTVASGRVSGTHDYPGIRMYWDVLGGCQVTGELHHDRHMPVQKWLRVVCPEADIDLSGKF